MEEVKLEAVGLVLLCNFNDFYNCIVFCGNDLPIIITSFGLPWRGEAQLTPSAPSAQLPLVVHH